MRRMTALEKYAKLEAIARYRDGSAERSQEVVLSFGERTLMIVGLDDQPISHWPLVNAHRLSAQGADMVVLAPFEGSNEWIELTDTDMIEAIDTIVPREDAVLSGRRPVRRKWRMWFGLLALGFVALLIWAWPMLTNRTVDLIPKDRAIVIGAAVREDVLDFLQLPEDGNGAICTEAEGRAALDTIIALVAGPQRTGNSDAGPTTEHASPNVTVFDHPAPLALAMPGGEVLLMRGMIELAGTPEALTAILAHEIAHAQARDPLRKILREASFSEKIAHVLGDLVKEPIPDSAAMSLLTRAYLASEEAAADAVTTARLNEAGLPSTPYAAMLLRLIMTARAGPSYGEMHPSPKVRASRVDASDPIGDTPFQPALNDRDWLVLQTICSGN